MRKHQRRPAFRLNRNMQLPILPIELRLATGEFFVEINHERQVTLFTVAAAETSVVMEGKLLAGIVPVEPKPFIQPANVPAAGGLRQEGSRTFPEVAGQRWI